MALACGVFRAMRNLMIELTKDNFAEVLNRRVVTLFPFFYYSNSDE